MQWDKTPNGELQSWTKFSSPITFHTLDANQQWILRAVSVAIDEMILSR